MSKDMWIKSAVNPKHKGWLRKELGVKQGEDIPAAKLAKAAKGKGVVAKRARLAQTLKSFNKK